MRQLMKVIDKIYYVPIEEYTFFILETVIVSLIWLICSPNYTSLKLPSITPLTFANSLGISVKKL